MAFDYVNFILLSTKNGNDGKSKFNYVRSLTIHY